MRALRNQGRNDSDDWFQHSTIGYNYRLSEMNCALGCAQMQRFDSILARREAVAQKYYEMLSGRSPVMLPPMSFADKRTSWFIYVVRLGTEFRQSQRDAVIQLLARKGISCGRYFAPIHQQPAYAPQPIAHSLPVTESESVRTIALPFFNRINEEEVERVCDSFLRSLETVSTNS